MKKTKQVVGYCEKCGAPNNINILEPCYNCDEKWVNSETIKEITLELLKDKPINTKISILDSFIEKEAFEMDKHERVEYFTRGKVFENALDTIQTCMDLSAITFLKGY